MPLSTRHRKYKINDGYFKKIDNKNKAYWLGFLMADGCVRERNRHSDMVEVRLSIKDINLLKLFINDIGSGHVIRERINSCGFPTAELEICSQELSEDLKKLGCIPNKSFKLKFPNINKKYYSHFIRGYFDGDGSICKNGNGYKIFKIIGTLQFINKIQRVLVEKCSLGFTKLDVHQNGINRILRYSGNKQLLNIFNYLYADATLFLNRKKLAWF